MWIDEEMVKLHEDEAQMCHSALPDAAGNEESENIVSMVHNPAESAGFRRIPPDFRRHRY